jgi:hypothetical protein
MVPHATTIPTRNTVVTQAPISTPLSSRPVPSLPHGYHSLNNSIPIPTQVPSGASRIFTPPRYNASSCFIPKSSQVPSGGSYLPFMGGFGHSGSNPIGGSTPSFTFVFYIPVGGQYNTEGKTQFGGHTQIGTPPPFGGKPPLRVHTPPYGKNIPGSLAQYWNLLIHGNTQSSRGKQPQVSSFIPPSLGQLYLDYSNPIWGLNVQSSVPFQGNIPNQYKPMGYMLPHSRLNMLGPSPHM